MNAAQRRAHRRRTDARDASGSLHGAQVDAAHRTVERVQRLTDHAVDGSRPSKRRDTSKRQVGVTDLSGDIVTGWNFDPDAPISRRWRGEAGTIDGRRRKYPRQGHGMQPGYWRSDIVK